MRLGSTLAFVCTLHGLAVADKLDDKAEADRHYQLGKRHYNLNEWDEAIVEFKAAYKLFPDPVNLYNIAQAYRLKGKHCTEAAQFYANYQREEKSRKLRDSVTKVRKDMEDCAKTERRDAEPLPVPPPVPEPAVVTSAPPPPPGPAPITPGVPTGEDALRTTSPTPPEPANLDPNRNRRIFGLVLLGGGGLFLVGGLIASGEVDEFDRKLAQCDDLLGCPGDQDPQTLQDRRDRANLSANSAYGVGFTAIAAGTVLYLISRKPKQDSRITVLPARGGAAVRFAF